MPARLALLLLCGAVAPSACLLASPAAACVSSGSRACVSVESVGVPFTLRRDVPRAAVNMAVSKSKLVDAIAEKAGVNKRTAGMVLTAALDVIVESVAKGDKVSLVGFGTFDSKERKARTGRNPKTGEAMVIPDAVVPTFSFGKSFKDAVKQQGSADAQ